MDTSQQLWYEVESNELPRRRVKWKWFVLIGLVALMAVVGTVVGVVFVAGDIHSRSDQGQFEFTFGSNGPASGKEEILPTSNHHPSENEITDLVETPPKTPKSGASSKSNNTDCVILDTNKTSPPMFEPIIDGLLSSSVTNIQVVNSSQFLAYRWLLGDPNVKEYNNTDLQSHFAMATLYFSTDGENWNHTDNWLSYNHSVCQWYSSLEGQIPCDDARSDILQELVLVDNGLHGSLPEELGLLTNLITISLSNNELTGVLPSKALSTLTMLEQMDLSYNSMRGRIPSEVGHLQSLEILMLQQSMLTNPLPTELGMATNLQYFNFGNNPRSRWESLFTEIGQLTNLHTLIMPYIFILTGDLPEEFFNLTSLINLDFKGVGQLNSTLPTLIGQLTNLETLELTQASFQGPLPTELALLTGLVNFNAELNQFTSTIPVDVGNMTNLKNFLVCNNEFTGSIPEEIGGMTSVDDIHLCGNELTGQIPASIGQLTMLTHLDLKENFLSGQVPGELDQLTAPQMALELQNNAFTGVVPAEVCSAVAFILADCIAEIECECCVQCF
ncbi:LRR receptor-like serine threonine-protein kinase [Seminavis robusta]|uniref:LRR receptor-like serine threonine-protein kinase n=1 Tax=Seminavis robusta TaxID=568900 RepID=A0A9N8EGB4_9STRA|nr:LRR receptor-like serine threonine-protein kinase [Seminavis robusta]|eukprot:Sro1119_g243220.1 LRR receptor-like serine threonine-protein kinase (558) ;mRNA; f:22580-24253